MDFLDGFPEAYADDVQRHREFREVFLSDERGRRVLNEILSFGHVFRISVVGQSVDPYQMAFREGERNMALRILAVLNTEPVEKPARARYRKE